MECQIKWTRPPCVTPNRLDLLVLAHRQRERSDRVPSVSEWVVTYDWHSAAALQELGYAEAQSDGHPKSQRNWHKPRSNDLLTKWECRVKITDKGYQYLVAKRVIREPARWS